MEIRKKITFQFIGLVAFILLVSSLAIGISFAQSRKEEFYDRLSSKARLVAQMLIDIDEIDTDLLEKIEKNNPLSLPGEKILIYNYLNEIIFSSDKAVDYTIPREWIDKVRIEGDKKFRDKSYEIYGQLYAGEQERIVVFTMASDIFGMKKLYRLEIILIIVFVLSLVLVFFIGRFFAANALMPITDIIRQVDAIEASSLHKHVEEGNGKDEIARLAKTFNRMLIRLENAFKMQKSFISNASHELRTPLTVLRGQLEVILLKDRDKAEYKDSIQSALVEIENVNELSNKLLLLAQASSDSEEFNQMICRIDDALWQAENEVKKNNPEYEIEISFSELIDSEDKMTIQGNDLLIKTVIINLIDNACKYSDNHRVMVFFTVLDSEVFLSFKDQGVGIPESEQQLVFQPFYRSRRITKVKGHGIGLSLVEKIVKLHKGDIKIISEEGKGSEFIVSLPLLRSY